MKATQSPRPCYPFVILRSLWVLASGRCDVEHELKQKRAFLAQSSREYDIFRRSFFNGASPGRPAPSAVFEVEFRFRADPGKLAHLLTLPFFAGFPGLLEKLWLEDEALGDYAGIYFFRSRREAENYSASPAQRFIEMTSTPGSYRKSVRDLACQPMEDPAKEKSHA